MPEAKNEQPPNSAMTPITPGLPLRPWPFLAPAFIFLLAFAFSLLGVNPTFFADDSPETVTACATFGIPHPPGYPLHTMVGHLFSKIPLGHFPFRVNLLSCVLGAALCAGLYLLMTRKFQVPPLLAAPLALFWIAGSTAYPASLSAKTGIYELTGLFLLAILGALLSGKLPLAFFLYGLSFANHWMSMLFFLPGFAVMAYQDWKSKDGNTTGAQGEDDSSLDPAFSKGVESVPVGLVGDGKDGSAGGDREEANSPPPPPFSKGEGGGSRTLSGLLPSGRVVVLLTLFLLGMTAYLVLPLRAHWEPALNWGDPSTLKEFIHGFLRSQYSPGEGKGTAADWTGQFGTYLATAAREFPWLLPFLLLGFLKAGRLSLPAPALLLTWGGLVGAFCLYLNLPQGQYFLIADYALPAHLFLLIFAAAGAKTFLDFLSARTGRDLLAPLAGLVVLLLGLQAAGVQGQRRQTDYTCAYDLCLNGFKAAPRGALYYVRSDSLVFSSWYFQWVEGKRQDLCAMGVDGLPMDWVREGLRRRHPSLKVPFSNNRMGAEAAPALMQWVLDQNASLPLYLSYPKVADGTLQGLRLVPYGVCARGFRKGEEPFLEEALAQRLWEGLRLRHLKDPLFPLDDRTQERVVREYAVFRNLLGLTHEQQGDDLRAKFTQRSKAPELLAASAQYAASYSHYLWASQWSPKVPEHPFNVGNSLYNMGRVTESIPWYEKAVALKPDYLDALFNAGVACYQSGEYRRARDFFERVLALKPDHAQARNGADYITQQGLAVKEDQARSHSSHSH